jgi:ABC-type Fe3+/spermidine/putrescine transport system ATPase subunit
MTQVLFENLTKVYPGADFAAVDDVSIQIPTGKLIAFLGPSGCGKTTMLKMITGLLRPTTGDITFDGESILGIPAEKRGAVMVFQNHLLFPYMSVGQNVGFGLKMRGVNKNVINTRVKEMLELVRLPDLSDRRPSELSGGQQQRVALARALIINPRVLLLDEPLSNLDAHLRDEMRNLILLIQRDLDVTTVFVTHDQEEAVLLADQVALIFDGKLVQYAVSSEFYERPISEKGARFFGGLNFIPGTRQGNSVATSIGSFDIATAGYEAAPEGDVMLTIRPERAQIVSEPGGRNCVQGIISNSIYVGTHTRFKVKINDIEIETVRGDNTDQLKENDQVTVYFPENRVWVVPRESN